MAVQIEVPFTKSVSVSRKPAEVLAFLKQPSTNIPTHFPGIDSLEKVGPELYDWHFRKLEYGGHSLTPKLLTKFEDKTDGIDILAQKKAGYSELAGYWRVLPEGAGSKIEFNIKLTMELPIPFFMKGMATPVVQRELSKLFQRYLENVGKTLSQ
jgi:carbon monoxide dehydrogenase subunit G